MAVMLITHDLGVIASFAEDVLVMYAGAPVEFGPVDEVFARAGHPYTQALLAAVPQLGDARAEALPSIPGVLPRADAIPPGCRFAPRCRLAGETGALPHRATGVRPGRPGAARRLPLHRGVARDRRRDPPAGGLAGRARRSARPCSSGRRPREGLPGARRLRHPQALAPRSRERRPSRSRAASRSGSSASPARASRPSRGCSSASRRAPAATVTFEGRPLEASSGGIAKEQRGRVQMVFQDPGDSLDPLMTVEQIVAEPLVLLHRARGAEASRPRPRAARARRPRGRLRQAAPAAALGRPAPARRDREGARDRPGADRLRRGRLVARRLGAGADPEPPAATCSAGSASSYLFISHDLSTVRHVCDRVAVMYGGQFVEVADADDIFTRAAAPVHDRAALGRSDPGSRAGARAAPDPPRGRAARPDARPSPGCIFASRCWKAQERCAVERPPLVERGGTGHRSACHFPENVA